MYDFNVVSEDYDAHTVTVQISWADLDLLIGYYDKKAGSSLGRNNLQIAMHYQKEASNLRDIQNRMMESIKPRKRSK